MECAGNMAGLIAQEGAKYRGAELMRSLAGFNNLK